jgi:putative ABC transport system permease protein
MTPWQERAPFYDQVRDLYSGIFRFLGAIVLLLVVLSSANSLIMTVFERMRELGVLRAIGTTPLQIARMLLAEALWLGVLGAAVGALLGLAGIAAINAAHLTMPPPPGAVDPIDLRLALVPEAIWGAGVLMTAVLALAALLPIARAVRVRVVDALRHV